ncbi:MAG: hypothetical protein K2P87_04675, partial [Lachnospiraceae bacterium]|nr:hypothetical protein [Lachnospiraceae bacterium]
ASDMAGMMMGMNMASQMVNAMNAQNSQNAANSVQGNSGAKPNFCPNCGQKTNGANFCPNCGQKLA